MVFTSDGSDSWAIVRTRSNVRRPNSVSRTTESEPSRNSKVCRKNQLVFTSDDGLNSQAILRTRSSVGCAVSITSDDLATLDEVFLRFQVIHRCDLCLPNMIITITVFPWCNSRSKDFLQKMFLPKEVKNNASLFTNLKSLVKRLRCARSWVQIPKLPTFKF